MIMAPSRLGFASIALTVLLASCHRDDPQDPTVMLPQSYKLEFENEWVRVVRVHYDAKAKLPEHTHAGGITVYLYFNASPGVVFSHTGGVPNTRPPVKPGGIRIGSAPLEHHTVENLGDTPTDFIRILLKTDYGEKRLPNSRMTPATMEYDHAALHIKRVNVAPGSTTRVEATNYPLLRIAWVPGEAEWKLADKDAYRFLDKGNSEEFRAGNVPMQLVTIELAGSPAKTQ
jgi:hypothetical protein